MNRLRLGIVKNQEILEISRIWVETQPSAQSACRLNFGNSNQKLRKRRYQNFLSLFSFSGFLSKDSFFSMIVENDKYKQANWLLRLF